MKQKIYYPVNLDLENKKCLVVGGGAVAERKIRSLLTFGASVTVVSPELNKGVTRLVRADKVRYVGRPYQSRFLKGVFLVIAATNDPNVNAAVSRQAAASNALVNVVDVPKLCNFFVPSILRRGMLVIAISTSGHGPAFAKRLNRQLKKQIGPHYGRFIRLLNRSRKKIGGRFTTMSGRKAIYRKIIDSPILGLLARKKDKAAGRLMDRLIVKG